MKPCLFCGALENSEEHVLSHSVWKRLGAGDAQLEAGVWDGVSVKEARKPHRQESYVTRAVCEGCNQGWMSNLEAAFLGAAGPLIEPEWPRLSDEFIAEAVRQGNVIASWAVKTAVTSNAAGVVQRPIHETIPRDLRAGNLPPGNFAVWIGHIRKPSVSIQVDQGFDFEEADGALTWKGPESNYAFDAVFQLNHLAIRAVHHPGLRLRYSNNTASMPVQSFPPARSAIVPGDYTFETLADFVGKLTVSQDGPQMVAGTP